MNIAIFLSGTGSNFKSIAAAIERYEIPADITLVASNQPDAPGLHAARDMGLPTALFIRNDWLDGKEFADYMLEVLTRQKVDLIALAGYLRKIPPRVIRTFKGRIINIHPALLPDFGGKGMFGMNVHRAVIEAGVAESGVSIHLVNEEYDEGDVIAQRRVPVLKGDTPETLAARVLKVEHQLYPEIIKDIAIKFKRKQLLND